jgi:hypothetical protein
MRTTISVPEDLFLAAQPFVGQGSFSRFVSEAIRHHVERLKRERLGREMEEGYRAEAESPSLDPIWHTVDGDGL